ncbi:hypothetical protein [Spirosoma montaniterrae]|uniref:Beta-carotene 15,15'-monooxygenase n=1 Tax=Spirosoma montaniterrae TaxID=1178516 RepID=A0A1P9WRW1_9BACT|nr:hypothetical protein [Spirosoma montaniterrae]AQG78115.1 hypothetical protein AWR27_01350 [Spirosoma montaniterrae]
MNILLLSFRQTLGSLRLVGLIYGLTLVLALVVALPFYSTLKVEDQDSRAFLTLLDGFDYTIYSDFMHRSERAISPLLRAGRWMSILYVFLSVFLAGGVLFRFSQPTGRFSVGAFLAACSHYAGRFLRLFGVTLLFVLTGAGVWLVAGSVVSIALSDTLTERGLFWIGGGFFCLFALTATYVLCIGDYAKVLMFREDERNAFRAFGRAGQLVWQNLTRTYGLYWLMILLGTILFGVYFLLDDLITMRNWPTILIMTVVQQVVIVKRIGLKIWWLGTAYHSYTLLPKPANAPSLTGESIGTPTARGESTRGLSTLPE